METAERERMERICSELFGVAEREAAHTLKTKQLWVKLAEGSHERAL